MTDYDFWSDSGQRGFERDLATLRVPYTSEGYVVSTEDGHDRLAAEWGATVKDDAAIDDGLGSSGLDGAGFNDAGAFSVRSSAANQPPGPPQYNPTFVNFFGPPKTGPAKVKRRKTRSQP